MARLTLYMLTFLALAGGCCPLFASTAPATPPSATIVYNTPTVTPSPTITPTPVPLVCGGGTIAFVGGYAGYIPQVYVMNADGSNLRQLTFFERGVVAYQGLALSPDGRRVAFGSDDIYTINLDRTGLHQVTHLGFILGGVSWSPDGKRLVFSSNGDSTIDIFAINADGSDLQQITHGDEYTEYDNPSWSPDGTKIAFAVNSTNQPSGLYLMNIDGTNRQLIVKSFYPLDIVWSPDGNFVSFFDSAVYIVNVHDLKLRAVTNNSNGFTWSPNSQCVLNATQYGLFMANTDISNVQPFPAKLPANVEVRNVVWGR